MTLDKKGYFVCLLVVLQCECFLSLPIPHGMHLMVPAHPYFLWVVCHPSKTYPSNEPEQEPQNRFSSPHCQTMPSYLWPMTSPPPVLAGYKLVIYGPVMCFISMYIRNLLAAHAFAVVWRFVCTFCRPSLASYGVNHFLASHSLKPAPFGAGLLLGRGLFLFRPTPFFFSVVFVYPAILLCHSCRGVIWPKLAGPLWACCLFFPQWLNIVMWDFLVTLGILGPFTFLGPFWPFS